MGCLLCSLTSSAQEMGIVKEQTATAIIEFATTDFDFGEVKSGEKVAHVFKFKNIGEEPLIITGAKGSCGCTVPYFPEDPILPGETSEIEVEFNTKNRFGKQVKRVAITANTTPTKTFLTIRGEVSKAEIISEGENDLVIQRNKEKEYIESSNPNCVAIYPNPTSHTLQVELKDYIGKAAQIRIFNDLGQKVMDRNIVNISRETTRFNVSDFSSGVYVISIEIKNIKPISQCFVVTGNK